MAEEVKYGNTLVSSRKDETLTYTKYVKDKSSGKSAQQLLDEKVNRTDEIETAQVKDGAITNPKLADDSVDARTISDSSISTNHLSDDSVTTEKVKNNAITNEKIADDTLKLNKFDADLRDAFKAATGMPEDLLQKVQNLTENVAELQDSEFPIVPSLSASFDGSNTVKITYTVKCKGEPFVPDTLELRSNNSLLSNVPASSGTASTTIPSVIHGISLKVGKHGRTSKTASIARYLVFHGASAVESADEEFIKTLNKAYVASIPSLKLRVDTKDGEYIWLVFPHDVTINRVTSGGFDVSLESPLHIDTELGAVHAYRTTNKLTAQTWNLVIS